MKPIRWSAHAPEKAAKREVQENEVERTHRATGFHCAGTMATPDFHATIFR